MKTQKNTIGARIRECRKKMGYSQEKLAEMIYLTKATVSKYESGSHDIPASVIAELTQVLKTTSDYLLLGRGGDEAAEDECIQVLMKIKDPALKNLALMQLECIAALEEES